MVSKNNLYLYVYSYIKENNKLPPSLSKNNLNYYLSRLKKDDYIKRLGYGVWKVNKYKSMPKDYPPPLYKGTKEIRGHNFVLTFQIPRFDNWFKREEFLIKNNIKFKKIGLNKKTHSIMFKGFKIWLSKKSIVIYNPSKISYYSNNAEDSLKDAIYSIVDIFKSLEVLFKVSLKIHKQYKFRVSKQHYGKIHDLMAIHFNKTNDKIRIIDHTGEWFIIDNSMNLNESETVHTKTAHKDMDRVIKPFLNDLKAHYESTGESVTFSKIMDTFLMVFKVQAQTVRYQEENNELIRKLLERL